MITVISDGPSRFERRGGVREMGGPSAIPAPQPRQTKDSKHRVKGREVRGAIRAVTLLPYPLSLLCSPPSGSKGH